MKYLFIGVSLSACLAFTACQSGAKDNNQAVSQEETQSVASETQQSATETEQAAAPTQAEAKPLPNLKEAAASIPMFKFYKVKSGIGFSNADIAAGKNTAFILFDPNCGHCRDEAKHLADNYDKLKDVNLYFVSMNDPALMSSFLETFAKELNGKSNVEVLYDRNQEFIQKFHIPKQFPANYVYGADGQLKSNWEGPRAIDQVIAEFTK